MNVLYFVREAYLPVNNVFISIYKFAILKKATCLLLIVFEIKVSRDQ